MPHNSFEPFPIVQHTTDVAINRLPTETITVEEYIRLGGIPVIPQVEGTVSPTSVTGSRSAPGQTFAYNYWPTDSRPPHKTDS